MKALKFLVTVLIPLVYMNVQILAQTDPRNRAIEKALQDYQDYSALGRSGSTFIDETTIASFRNLFEMDANLFWDLFRTRQGRSPYLLTLDEYIDSIQLQYSGKKPVITYGKHRHSLNDRTNTALAYMRKTIYLPEVNDPGRFRLNKTCMNLRILFNIRHDTALIQNITEDTRLARVRSLNFEGCYSYYNKIGGSLFAEPVTSVNPGFSSGYSLTSGPGYCIGVSVDLRINRKKADGILVSAGLLYTADNYKARISDYVLSSRQVIDPEVNPFEISVFDRSPQIIEEIKISGISIPVALKWYPVHRVYLKAGLQVSFFSATSRANYTLSHTGGGKCILLNESSLPENEKKWFYLDELHEMDEAQYGFFRNREFSTFSSVTLATAGLSAIFAAGVEARVKNLLIGIEPCVTLGLTGLTGKPGKGDYPLCPETESKSFLQTLRVSKLNSLGVKLIIGNIFSR